MKNKSLNLTKLLLAMLSSLMLSQASHAIVISPRKVKPAQSKPSQSSGTVDSGTTSPNAEVSGVVEGSIQSSCNLDMDKEKYFPIGFFNSISLDGSGVEINLKPNNEVSVKFPPTFNKCGSFTAGSKQDPETKNVTVFVSWKGVTPGKTTFGDYVACLKTNNFLVADDTNPGAFKIDEAMLDRKGFSEYESKLSYSYDSVKDQKKTVKLSYAYPASFRDEAGNAPMYGLDKDISPSNCIMSEKINTSGITYINQGQDIALDKLRAICESGSAQQIADARRSIGNGGMLQGISEKIMAALDVRYLAVVKPDIEKIYEDMKAIEKKFSGDKDKISESTATAEIQKYATLANDLNNKFLDPAIKQLESLMKLRESMPEGSEQKKLDEEIRMLNADISKFGRSASAGYFGITEMFKKFALTESGQTINDVHSKSEIYGRVYPGDSDKRGKQLSMEEAAATHEKRSHETEKMLDDYKDIYLAAHGSEYPKKKAQGEQAAGYAKLNKNWDAFASKERSNENKYCTPGILGTVPNPVQCTAFRQGASRRYAQAMKRRNKDLSFIKGRESKLKRIDAGYADYSEKKQAADELEQSKYDEYGSTISGYDEEFQDRFPGYTGSQMPIGYNYQSRGNNGMNFNQPSYNNYNPQQQVAPGQFQLQQGWAGI